MGRLLPFLNWLHWLNPKDTRNRTFSDHPKFYHDSDPRDDLNGMDVARKVVILARTCGLSLEVDALPVENIVPPQLQSAASPEAFMRELPNYDGYFDRLNREALAESSVLRYVGNRRIDSIGTVDVGGNSSVKLVKVPASHPFASLNVKRVLYPR